MKEYKDYYFRKAKQENYPARSIYKLKEIDARHNLLRRGIRVLDLGAAPGSWSLGAAEKIGPEGLVLACDIQETDTAFPDQIVFMQEDIFNPTQEFLDKLKELGPFDLVMSDMAPATTGNKLVDQARSLNLAMEAFNFACENLRPTGNFVVKIFMGPDIQELLSVIRSTFRTVKTFKPKSSRPESKETFFIGLDFKDIKNITA